ncbi:MAG: CYTH domain-containing protein [bacterium]
MNKANIEAEIRSFITDEEYQRLLDYFQKDAKYLGEDDQTTYYFNAPQDLRIQKNEKGAKIWSKSGRIHDEAREELEIYFTAQDFEKLEKLFIGLGFEVKIKWFRKRHSFDWAGIIVTIDNTKGYGKIIELEKMCDSTDQEKALEELKNKLKSLDISLTARQEFDERFDYYKKHWPELIGD